jgi:hypothetical protein
MQFSLRWLLLLITAICLALAWFSHFQLELKHILPISFAGVAGIACSGASLFFQRDLRLGMSVTGAIAIVLDAIWTIFWMYTGSTSWTHGSAVVYVLEMSAAVVVLPALALFPVAYSIRHDPISRASRPVLLSLGLGWLLLLLHFALINWFAVHSVAGAA